MKIFCPVHNKVELLQLYLNANQAIKYGVNSPVNYFYCIKCESPYTVSITNTIIPDIKVVEQKRNSKLIKIQHSTKCILVNDLYKVNHRTVIPSTWWHKDILPIIKDDKITIDEHFNEIKDQSKCLSDLVMNYFLYCIKRTKQFVNSKLYEKILDLRVEGMLATQGTPIGNAVALAYVNAVMNGSKLTQRDISESMHFTESALRENLKKLKIRIGKLE